MRVAAAALKLCTREDFIMKEFWNTIQIVFTAVGGWLGWFLGGCDGLLYALIAFVTIDYITGVMCAVVDHTLSSEVGFKGIARKVLIFLLVGIGHILDTQVIGSGSVLRTAVTENPVVSFSPLKKGTEIGVCDEMTDLDYEKWYYIEFEGRHGFVCGKYVERV